MVRALLRMTFSVLTIAGISFYIMLFGKGYLPHAGRHRVLNKWAVLVLVNMVFIFQPVSGESKVYIMYIHMHHRGLSLLF